MLVDKARKLVRELKEKQKREGEDAARNEARNETREAARNKAKKVDEAKKFVQEVRKLILILASIGEQEWAESLEKIPGTDEDAYQIPMKYDLLMTTATDEWGMDVGLGWESYESKAVIPEKEMQLILSISWALNCSSDD